LLPARRGCQRNSALAELCLFIPLADHSEFMMYGNDVMDLTILGLRSM